MSDNVTVGIWRTSFSYMFMSAALGIILGLIMLFYPGGTMALMEAAFIIFQALISIFIIYYTFTEAAHYFKTSKPVRGVLYGLIGIAATILVWVFNANLIYFIIALFLILTGITDIMGGIYLTVGRYFLIFLGIVNVLIAVIILRHPIVLPLLIAWYVLFWGISRLFLSIELRKVLR